MTSGDELQAFAIDRVSENGRGCGSVSSDVRGLGSHFLNHLSAHILEALKLDLLSNRYTIFGNSRSAEALFDNNDTTLRSHRYSNSVSELLDPFQDLFTSVCAKFQNFSHVIPY